jgi:hypothetical protein
MDTTQSPVLEKPLASMASASTEISASASAKVDAVAKRDERTRAFVLRKIIHEWADKQPTPKKAKS